ncbi:DNA-binding transcriptional LysR family regulator [Rhizobium sp. BK313]|uniref:LysR family transcriptional regulator n=1 Tax=Rhizobium sp. BK313 TaxID=2587081 RepID=UPI00105FE527|nr:LysR family transcriptional regulator [Rhizobium sp. BK313]MBB3458120.1 DNA-binding transcriptional LysR family regulator [Rhizobium sp. BK313]
MNLRQLEVFHAIMSTGSVTGAARKLNVTQPAVSTVLKHCEQQLQMRLFVRKGSRLEPTPEALTLFPDVAEIFERVRAVERLGQDLRGGLQGTLSIAACFPEANGVIARAVATFMQARPDIKISLYAVASPIVVDKVVNREVDLGIAYGPVTHPEVSTKTLFHSSIGCVLPEGHRLARQDSIKVAELRHERVITYLNQSPMRTFVDLAFSEANVSPVFAAQVSISLSGMMLARFGGGIAVVEPLLLSSLELPGLVARPLDPAIEVSTLALHNRNTAKSVVAQAFLLHLASTIEQLPALRKD